jgi:hypothetical protein
MGLIHIVFQYTDIEVLREAMGMDPELTGEIIQIKDDFAVGPIRNSLSVEGKEMRKEWWREVLAGGDIDGRVDDPTVADDWETVNHLAGRLSTDPSLSVWIWVAQNKHDLSGYYWMIGQLKDFQGRIFLLHLNNLPFINSKGAIFYPANLFEIPAKEFLKAKKLARAVTASEFETDPDEWLRLGLEEKGVRILEGSKKLAQFDYDFYDAELKKLLSGDWIKASKLIHQFLVKSPQITGDAYLLWRLKMIVAAGEIAAQGELKRMKDFEVKLLSKQVVDDQPS